MYSACLHLHILQTHIQTQDLHTGRIECGQTAVDTLPVVAQCIHISCALQQNVACWNCRWAITPRKLIFAELLKNIPSIFVNLKINSLMSDPEQPAQCSQYSDQVMSWASKESWINSQWSNRLNFLKNVHISSQEFPAPYSISTKSSFPRGKSARA